MASYSVNSSQYGSDDEFEIIDSHSNEEKQPIEEIVTVKQRPQLDENNADTANEQDNDENEFVSREEVKVSSEMPIEETAMYRLTRVIVNQKREIESLTSQLVMNSIKAEISETRWEEEKREMKKAHEDAMAEKDAEIDRLRRMNDQGKKIEEYKKVFLGLRTIRFRKVKGKFGAGHIGSCISSIEKGGPADLAGLVEGDQLISINGVNVETKSDDQITKMSEDVEDDVVLVVRFNPERLIDLWRIHSNSANIIKKCEALRNKIVVPSI
ncbi:hypothetical protein PRIPAC_85220 [Pristionchus pacificus]|uniref:PDZ domain-containing protein n=1 Tax=Pristionchus pacificus TaxID=54126 RepID=A0A2A6BMY1_PRIPA|nr:hypothetical protein PRIPAC_85220 [Pristionchus pacificus]|eukprot:PDM67259.1 PDZ domain-containing protein [Pristionchus pacificus]